MELFITENSALVFIFLRIRRQLSITMLMVETYKIQ